MERWEEELSVHGKCPLPSCKKKGSPAMDSELRPKQKSTAPHYRVDDMLYISASGASTQIPDPTGCVQYLLELMDGTRTLRQIAADMQRKYPEVTVEEI